MYRYRVEYLKDAESHVLLVEEHRCLYEALGKGDGDGAAKLMQQHISRQEEYILRTLAGDGGADA